MLLWISLAFAAAVVALGRFRGLAALGGLVASLVVLFWFVLPGILDGQPPVLVAVVGAAVIAYAALYIAHGFRPLTTVALIGTVGSLMLTALLSWLVVALASLTGLASEEASFLTLFSEGLDFQGLVLAGIVLGAMGALDDVTVTQAFGRMGVASRQPPLDTGTAISCRPPNRTRPHRFDGQHSGPRLLRSSAAAVGAFRAVGSILQFPRQFRGSGDRDHSDPGRIDWPSGSCSAHHVARSEGGQ